MDCDSIIESMRQEFLLRTEKQLQKEKSEIGRRYQKSGMYSSSVHANAVLQTEFKHREKLFDHILGSIEKDFPSMSFDDVKNKLFVVADEEYNRIISKTQSLLNRIALGNITGYQKKVLEEAEDAKKKVALKCSILEAKQKSSVSKTNMDGAEENIIEVKPNIWGIGVNLNNLWRKLKSRFKR